MANALYGLARQGFLLGTLSWTTTLKVCLVDAADYTVSIDTNQYMNTNTVATVAKVATVTLTGLTATLGVADAFDATFTTVSGDTSEALVIWKDGGGGGTSTNGTADILIAYIDSATGLPVIPNGGNITITWDNGANLIFKL